MSRMRLSILTLVALLGGLLLAGPVQAQQKPDFAAARKHYMDAQTAEKAGDYDSAVKHYAAAYDITKDAKILYSVARAYEAGGNKDAAVVYYRRYVNEAKEAKDRDSVKKHIAELEGKPAPAVGEPKPPAGGEPKPPPGGELIAPVPPPSGGETPPPGGGEGGGADPEDLEDAPSLGDGGSRWPRTAGWVSVGIAAVALTTGAVLGESAWSREEDIARLQDFRDPASGQPTRYTGNVKQDYEDAIDEGKSMETYSIIAFSVAGAATAAAIVFFVLDPGADEAPEATTSKAGHPYLLPVVSSDGVGLAAGWGF
jgi:tetratricopeptide (TPR) repeat protein